MKYYRRALKLNKLLKLKSIFLFGPRSTGKTAMIQKQVPQYPLFDLLNEDVFGELARRPTVLSEQLPENTKYVVIDEIQRLPLLLNEVQRLIQSKGIHFLLTGSSARKIKRGSANTLGGRAWEAHLHPLTSFEISDFNLMKYLNCGGLPYVYLSQSPEEELRSYTNLYLKEEIQAEALTRNISHFAQFLDLMALQNGEELNFESMASDTGISASTIRNYLQILEDTLIGFQLPAFRKTKKRKAVSRSKFYYFDIGVTHILAKRSEVKMKSELFGKCFEHFLLLEIRAYLNYFRKFLQMTYWRSHSQFEVDCVIGQKWAFEFKAVDLVQEKHMKGLLALAEEGLIEKYGVVSLDQKERKIGNCHIFPWKIFLKKLWNGEFGL